MEVSASTIGVVILFQLGCPLQAQAQSAPQLVSVAPADGASGVATNSTIVFLFDQDMNVRDVPYPGVPPTLIGNFKIAPASSSFAGSWGQDQRTLTFKTSKGMPYGTNISWTLNPPDENFVLPLTSAAGQVLATVSGSFQTAVYVPPPPIPKLLSVTPTNRATQISPTSPLVFVFDQDMDTTRPLKPADFPSVTGNYRFSPSTLNTQFNGGTWDVDKRTLTFKPIAPLPLATLVEWILNETGATVSPIQSAAGQALAPGEGGYQIISDTGGKPIEICPPIIPTDTYTLTRTLSYRQTSASEIVPDVPAAIFELRANNLSRRSGLAIGQVTNTVVTLPTGRTVPLVEIRNLFVFSDSASSTSALDAAYPPGNYTWEIDQFGETNHAPVIDVPAQLATVPMVTNFAEAQDIDPTQSFTLHWNGLSPSNAGAFINLLITDTFGKVIFQTPNPCARRTLAPTATSAVIPANYLRAGLNYNGMLQFSTTFYNSFTDVPLMVGFGVEQQTTRFPLGTVGSTVLTGGPGTNTVAVPAKFTAFQILPADLTTKISPIQLTLTGTPGKTYQVISSLTLSNPNWRNAGSVTMNAAGTADLKVPLVLDRSTSAHFYVAITTSL